MLDMIIVGLAEFESSLDRLAAGLTDPRPALRMVAEVVADSTERRFAQGGEPRWPDIKPETRRRRKGNKAAPPLTDLGNLRSAATATRPGVKDSLFGITPDVLKMGVDRPDTLRHQVTEGRPFLLVDHADEKKIAGALDAYLSRLTEQF